MWKYNYNTKGSYGEDELYHYKYVDRVKVDGKWRYYYTDDKKKSKNLPELNDQKRRKDLAIEQEANNKYFEEQMRTLKKSKEIEEAKVSRRKSAFKKRDQLLDKYNKTPIRRIDFAIDHARKNSRVIAQIEKAFNKVVKKFKTQKNQITKK